MKKRMILCGLIGLIIIIFGLWLNNYKWNHELCIAVEKNNVTEVSNMLKEKGWHSLNVVASDEIWFPLASGIVEYSALQIACKEGLSEIVEMLIDSGADPNYIGLTGYDYPIVCSWVYLRDTTKRIKVETILLENGANINKRYGEEWPIEWIAYGDVFKKKGEYYYYSPSENKESVKELELFWKHTNNNVLQQCLKSGSLVASATNGYNYEGLKWLIEEKDAQVDILDEKGRNVLYLEKPNQRMKDVPLREIVDLLVQNGLDLGHKDNQGQTAYEYARFQGNTDLANVFKQMAGSQ